MFATYAIQSPTLHREVTRLKLCCGELLQSRDVHPLLKRPNSRAFLYDWRIAFEAVVNEIICRSLPWRAFARVLASETCGTDDVRRTGAKNGVLSTGAKSEAAVSHSLGLSHHTPNGGRIGAARAARVQLAGRQHGLAVCLLV